MIYISDKPLDISAALTATASESAGAIDIFVGTVRNKTKGRPVVRLEFEAYDKMAESEMNKLAEEIKQKWPVEKISIIHRKGALEVGETAVIIAVSTPHRAASFKACRYAIDQLKERVPIWKKEIFEDGEMWVSAHA
ncbi:molybdenum cofactor biosynthesis protein MoaE [Flammeovirgaceae bacterium SG7u.111]|nr:molybdenum cofactor biosynthesis protein MoaE [Flammeovirgaceae bacterium SG7u.132]WPO36896.1 molybdenum cofactor biosynthesis protein MoaE [Flammeovirgaceae bacterium SG7u.111]